MVEKNTPAVCQCPGSAERTLKTREQETPKESAETKEETQGAELGNWPVQLHLLSSNASYLDGTVRE